MSVPPKMAGRGANIRLWSQQTLPQEILRTFMAVKKAGTNDYAHAEARRGDANENPTFPELL